MSTRPGLDLKVNDDVFIINTAYRERKLIPARVTKVARVYVTVARADGDRYMSGTEFNKETGKVRATNGYPSSYSLTTPKREEYDSNMRHAVQNLRRRGFELGSTNRPTDGEIIAVARALRMLDALEAADAESTTS